MLHITKSLWKLVKDAEYVRVLKAAVSSFEVTSIYKDKRTSATISRNQAKIPVGIFLPYKPRMLPPYHPEQRQDFHYPGNMKIT
jgi:hypothetical protein